MLIVDDKTPVEVIAVRMVELKLDGVEAPD
jgi:hypothetical protein